jgi:hypothetical protein
MFVRPSRSDALGRSVAWRRSGAVLPWFIVCGPVLLLALLWTLTVALHRHRQEELKVAVEEAALSGCNYLVDEELLTDHPCRFQLVRDRAREAVQRFALYSRVDGRPLQLDANLENDPEGEILLGQLAHPFRRDFFLHREKGNKEQESPEKKARELIHLAGLDAVRVKAERGGTVAAATAWVDRYVIGFRPQGVKPMPVVPLAILSDPFGPPLSAAAESWEWSIEARQGTFRWMHDPRYPHPRHCEPGECDDRIPEITLCFSTKHHEGNARGLWIGAEQVGDLARQTWTGLTRDDLRDVGGALVLPADQPLFLPCMKLTKSELEDLADALEGLRETGERRIWMLYSPVFDTKSKDGVKATGVLGFVAAQVMHVQLSKDKLCVVLQPGMRITDTAITDIDRPDEGPRPLWNPYVCRVRLVE